MSTEQSNRNHADDSAVVVLAAVLATTLLTAATGMLSQSALLARVAVLAGTRVRTSWDALTQSQTIQLLKAALEPPELPEDDHRE